MNSKDKFSVISNKVTNLKNDNELADLQVTPPRHLSADAKRLYRNLYPELKKLGKVKAIDLVNLEQYCNFYAIYLEAEAYVIKNGSYLLGDDIDENGNEAKIPYKRSPAAIQLDNCVKNLGVLGKALGLSFDSGLRTIEVSEPKEKKGKSPREDVNFGADV